MASEAKLSISVGEVTVNGKRVGGISGFAYEGPAEGLPAALATHRAVEQAMIGTPVLTSLERAVAEVVRDGGRPWRAEIEGRRRPDRVVSQALNRLKAKGAITEDLTREPRFLLTDAGARALEVSRG